MNHIETLLAAQRAYFQLGNTRSRAFRINALSSLEQAVRQNENELCRALEQDLGKSHYESYMCEISLVLEEIRFAKRHLARWMRPRRAPVSASQMPARGFVISKPLGTSLIMSPWNYPVLLSLEPLVGAIAAGCCAIVKPSAYAPATSTALREMLESCFPAEHVAVVEGGRQENAALLEQHFDKIFFTGSVAVGKLVMEKASRFLTPVTLELGGKSPCIVDETADIALSAKRIAFGKFLNAGQTCVAPDYILCQESVKNALLEELEKSIHAFFGDDPLSWPDYGRIINQKHFERLCGLLNDGLCVCGGQTDPETLRIAPTILDGVTERMGVMQEEIFGPILPVLTYRNLRDAMEFIQRRPKPLALYLFTRSKEHEKAVLGQCSYGGGCVNDTILHLASSHLGFGGVGDSGMGAYHGKQSFDCFSHQKSILKKAAWPDLSLRYQPYTSKKEKMLHLFLK
ncbi:aldehyde dehydrogenase [Ruthenibacterium sp. CLA-JM-H11]|uniref:Aldehyde dehydrogenase n=1 Tax=Ruthenibacterium intestinale TaxID=3133163 RepID=A0ABV1GGG9_9FIRM